MLSTHVARLYIPANCSHPSYRQFKPLSYPTCTALANHSFYPFYPASFRTAICNKGARVSHFLIFISLGVKRKSVLTSTRKYLHLG